MRTAGICHRMINSKATPRYRKLVKRVMRKQKGPMTKIHSWFWSYSAYTVKIMQFVNYHQQFLHENNWRNKYTSDVASVWQRLILPTYFTIQLIFCTIQESRCTFWYYFMGLTVLFQLTFTFIYNTFNKKFSVSAK